MTEHPQADWVGEAEFAFAGALADMDGDVEAFRELASIYEEELPGQLQLLEGAAADVDRLLPVLHEAANTLGVVGARLYSRKIRDIEEELRAGDLRRFGRAAQDTAAAMQRTGAALRQWLDSRGG